MVLRVKIGAFLRYNVTLFSLLFEAVLFATFLLFLVCSRFRRGRLGSSTTLMCVRRDNATLSVAVQAVLAPQTSLG